MIEFPAVAYHAIEPFLAEARLSHLRRMHETGTVYDIQTDTTRPMTDDERALTAAAFARANIAPGDS